jgi:hypothetical protein
VTIRLLAAFITQFESRLEDDRTVEIAGPRGVERLPEFWPSTPAAMPFSLSSVKDISDAS